MNLPSSSLSSPPSLAAQEWERTGTVWELGGKTQSYRQDKPPNSGGS